MQFTENEIKAIKLIVNDYASIRGEDVIGAIMLTGGFRYLKNDLDQFKDTGVGDLAEKLEHDEDTTLFVKNFREWYKRNPEESIVKVNKKVTRIRSD
jgi:hypothetical protein